jgi:putative oxidoreductase
MKAWSLLLTRITLGWLLVLWGLDKLVNVEHSIRVADSFYLGIASGQQILNVFGVLEIVLGLFVIVGFMRRYAYPIATIVLALTAVGVWKSIVDPWGWVLEGTNVLFYPSAIVLAAALVLLGFQDEDRMTIDAKRGG